MRARRRRPARAAVALLVVLLALTWRSVTSEPDAAAAMPLPWEHAADAGALPLPRRALLQGDDAPPPPPPADPAGGRQPTPPGRCKVLALPCVASVLGQSGAGPCSGPATFDRDNTCCPIVRDFVQSGCACDGPFLAIASFGGWNGEKLAQAVRTILSTPCGKGLKDGACLLTCPPPAPQPK